MSFTLSNHLTPQDLTFFYQHTYQSSLDAGLAPNEQSFEAFCEELEAYNHSKQAYTVIIARSEADTPAGFIWAANRGTPDDLGIVPDLAWVYDIQVLPEFRRQGLGRLLLSVAQDWAKTQRYSHLGLHVFGDNHGAIQLYKTSGFTLHSCYLQKELSPSQGPNSASNLSLQPVNGLDEVEAYKALSLAHFAALTRQVAPLSEQQIEANHAAHLKKYRFENEKKQLLLLKDSNGDAIGGAWFYQSKGDLGSTPYLWVQEAISPTTKLTMQLFAYLEDWAVKNGLSSLRTMQMSSENKLIQAMQNVGFRLSNLFMQKEL